MLLLIPTKPCSRTITLKGRTRAAEIRTDGTQVPSHALVDDGAGRAQVYSPTKANEEEYEKVPKTGLLDENALLPAPEDVRHRQPEHPDQGPSSHKSSSSG
ncbi:hypothetical protein E4U53_007109 [Claviceps sorghi]|nr:hypothetical protein E4U53_007109 [Claviceps sorghi]